ICDSGLFSVCRWLARSGRHSSIGLPIACCHVSRLTRSRTDHSVPMNTENLHGLAPDLNRVPPRSPYAPLGDDFPAVAARLVDKCRAELLGQSGSYHYDCPLDRKFFAASGLEAGPLREFIATGADDDQVAAWMKTYAKVPTEKVIK